MNISTVLIAGAGVMGSGIAQIYAQAGFRIAMVDVEKEIIEKSIKRIHWSLG
jgi:3-hydroxybutyryl-CoA dehydrogenase